RSRFYGHGNYQAPGQPPTMHSLDGEDDKYGSGMDRCCGGIAQTDDRRRSLPAGSGGETAWGSEGRDPQLVWPDGDHGLVSDPYFERRREERSNRETSG